MKHVQRTSFRINPVASAVALVLATQFAGNVAQAGSGFGSGLTVANSPVAIPTYYANSPAGPAPTLVNGQTTIIPVTGLPTMATTGTALRKFVDPLKLFGAANANSKGQYIPVAVPEKWVDSNGVTTTDDYYEIAAVDFTEQLHSDLPKATHLRGYVQLETPGNAATSKHIALYYPAVGAAAPVQITKSVTDPLTGAVTQVPVLAYDAPHHLGPVINSTKGTAVRVKFTNYLPVGTGGNLFVPVDTTITGAGPVTVIDPATKLPVTTSYTQNRAEIHLVGAQAPWISAGTPHQWVAPAGETAAYTAGIGKGVSTQNVPDMADPGPGAVTLFFPNDMSARFTFYQDSTSGLTRLNSYVGLEAGYVVTDPIETALVNGGTIGAVNVPAGTIPAATLPLIFEDKTFVPANVAQQDALWDTTKWGVPGDLWFPHVYEANQDPNQAAGANPVGRWDYGPMFWPLAPVAPSKATLPSPSFVPEAYMDTPLVNGTAYPTVTVEPKAYRVRLLNASNDRYLNLGFYVADGSVQAPVLDANGNPTVSSAGVQQFMLNTEVKMVPAAPINALGSPPGWDVANGVQLPLPQFIKTPATATTPAVPYFPWHINAEPSGPTRAWPVDARVSGVPDPTTSGPDFIVIGNDGGFLPGAVDIPSQPITYEQNRRSITVTNIYGYGMLLGPAERADTVVDFSAFAGKTLILFNDAPAPTPFIDPRNDYYTGNPDQTGQGGTYTTQPGYGPNTRTMMQVVVSAAGTVTSGGPLNPAALAAALPAAYGASQPQPLVTESIYNPAFGTANVDTYGRVATGSAAQPNMAFAHTGAVALGVTAAGLPYVDPVSGSKGFTLVTSGGVGTGSGSGYLTAPQVVLSAPQTAGGVQATATATINAKSQVAQVNLTNAGSGYTAAPTVTFLSDSTVSGATVVDGGSGYVTGDVVNFVGGGGTGAVGKVSTVNVAAGLSLTPANLNGGAGYTLPPTVTLTNVGAAPTLAATVSVTLTSSTLVAGTTGVTAMTPSAAVYSLTPTTTVSAPQVAGVTATATPIIGYATSPIVIPAGGILPNGGVVGAAAIVGSTFDQMLPPNGSGTGTTTISFSKPQLAGGTMPVATVTVDATGAVSAINYTSFGSGYTSPPTATIADAIVGIAPNQAAVATTLAAGTGVLSGVTITSAGSGYTAPATVTVTDTTGPTATTTAGVLVNGAPVFAPIGAVKLTVNNPGQGYTAAPTVQFTTVGAAPTTAATAILSLGSIPGSITGVTMTNVGSGYLTAPAAQVVSVNGTGANLTAGLIASGVGAQAAVVTSTTSAPVVMTKAEQELWDDYGRYNSTGGVELPYTTAAIQTTVPLSYIDSPTEVIGDGETQIWKLVDNGFWSNSIHFNMANVQLINRVGWDGTVKAPASNEVGWKDTLRLNPLEDVIVAVQGKRATVPFGQPRSARLQDPSTPFGTPTAPAAPAAIPAGLFAPGLGFLADPNVTQLAGLMATTTLPGGPADKVVPVSTVLLQTSTNTSVLPGSPTGNYDNEFLWGTAVLGHASNDFQRPVVFNPTVTQPDPSLMADALGTGTLTWNDPTPVGQLASAPGVVPVLAATLGNPKNEIGYAMLQAPITDINKKLVGNWTPLASPFVSLLANTVSYKEPAALVAPNLPTYYAYQLVAYNVAGTTPSNVVYEAPPAAPTTLNLTPSFIVPATTTSDVSLTAQWQDVADNETNYVVTKIGGPGATLANGHVTGGTTTTTLAPPNQNLAVPTTTWVDPAPLVEGAPYEYDVIARNSFGDSTPVLSGTVVAPISVPLAPTVTYALNPVVCPTDAVTKIVVPTKCAPDDVVLTWTDKAFNETSYTIDRSGGAAFPTITWTPATSAALATAMTLNNTGTTMIYTDTTAQENVAYTYTIAAHNAVGAGSTTVAVTEPLTAPTLPTNVKVTPSTKLIVPTVAAGAPATYGVWEDLATISWSDNAYNEQSYQVVRDLGTTAAIVVGTLNPAAANNPMGTKTGQGTATPWTTSPVLSLNDTGATDGTTHTWTVQAINPAGTTSAAVTQTMPGIVITPPINLVATPNRTGLSIGLQWTDMSTNETDFLVEEATSTAAGAPGTFTNWTVVQPVITRTLTQQGQTNVLVNVNRGNVPTTTGLVYEFRVSARNQAAQSDSHPYLYAQASLQQPVLTGVPVINAPTVSANGRVGLTWTAVAAPTGTTMSYRVSITNAVTGVVTVVNVGGAAYNFRPTLLSLQQGLSFSVQAVATAIRVANPTVFGTTVGSPSNTVSFKAVMPAVPAVPGGLAATISVAGAVTLNWTAVTPAAGTTITYLAIIDGAAPVAITRGAALALALGTTHTVQVATVATSQGLSSTSAYTTPATTIDLTAALVPNAPATLTVNATTLNWTAPAALAGTGSTGVTYTYNVQKSVDGGLTWTLLTPTPITARTLAAASPAGTNYQYQVQAIATRYGLAASAAGAWRTTVFNTAALVSTGVTNALAATPARTFNVSFNNTSLNLTGFTVQRRLGAGAWTTVVPAVTVTPALNTATTYSFSDTVAAAGSYTYRVAASSAAGGALVYSAVSNAVVTP